MGTLVYRVLLLALPSDLRHEFGDDMVQLFRDYRRQASGHPIALVALWIAAARDVVQQAWAIRRWEGRRVFSMRSFMRAFVSDFRHGVRLLRRHPMTSVIAVITLALGIGANTAIFSVVDAVLLRTLPYPEPERLVMVWEKRPREGVMTNVVSPADFLDWRRMNTVFETMAAEIETQVAVAGDPEPVQVPAIAVSFGFFDVLRVPPAIGRTFRAEDEQPGHRVAILSYGFWQRRFAGDRQILGRVIEINANPWEVIGVLPKDFQFVEPVDIVAPLPLEGGPHPPTRVSHQLAVYARLKPGVSFAEALNAMDRLGQQLEQAHPQESRGHGAHVVTVQDHYVRSFKTSLVLFAAVGLVLLIACVNTANLLLARAASRGREMAVRSALGAGRARLIVQGLVETLGLALAGGVAGVGIAMLIVRALPLVMPERMSIVGLETIQLDGRVLLFTLTLSLLTGVLFGLLPAIQASRPDLANTLKEGGRGPAGVRRRARVALVVGEVTLATLTLVGAGLIVRSFNTMMSQPLGFDPHNRLALTLAVPPRRYPTQDARRLVLEEFEQRLGAVPGVQSIGAVSILPMSGDSRQGVVIEGREPTPDTPTRMHPRVVTPTYFKTMGIALVAGRAFTPQDDGRVDPVVIVSETSARRYWPGSPVGKRMRFTGDESWRTVVGVARDVRHWGLAAPVNPMLYLPQAQYPSSSLTFVMESGADAPSLVPALRDVVARVDKNLPLGDVRTMDDVVARSVRPQRAQMVLMTVFGGLALLLAVIGIYGVMAQLVTVRVHEIGVRMTLGARPVDVLRQLLVEGLWQTAIGLVLGLAAGAYLMRFAQTVLVDIKPWDGMTLGVVALILVTSALAACFIPARRAMQVDPVQALRE